MIDVENHFRPCACRSSTPYFSTRYKDLCGVSSSELAHVNNRTIFQHDRDKVLYSHAFRRLRLKTQIYPEHAGDHLRTRLDHTLEVSQIARHLARSLELNEDLVDAIALAHDIGHAPFAHSGERALHSYLTASKPHLNGFKHNWQGLRVVDSIEKAYPGDLGLNLSTAVRIGILRHGSLFYKYKPEQPCNCDILEGVFGDRKPDCPSLNIFEVQLVSIADHIAGAIHDLEDAIMSKIITFNDIEAGILNSSLLNSCLKNVKSNWIAYLSNMQANEKISYTLSRVRSEMIYLLTEDIINNSKRDLVQWEKKVINCKSIQYNNFIQEKCEFPEIIKFYEYESEINNFNSNLRDLIINSEQISRMDSKADYIIHRLMNLYRTSPRQVPNVIIEMIAKITKKDYYLQIRRFNNSELAELYIDKDYIRVLADYISGMTDRFALKEYDLLFSPYPKHQI